MARPGGVDGRREAGHDVEGKSNNSQLYRCSEQSLPNLKICASYS